MKVSGTQLLFSSLGAAALSCGVLAPVHALTLTTFTDQAEFEAIATGLSLETFDSATLSDDKNHTLRDFSITSNMTRSRIVAGNTDGSIDGSTFLSLRSQSESQTAELNFLQPLNAFGFDWVNTDNSGDILELRIDNQVFQLGSEDKKSGFFGVIAMEEVFSTVIFADDKSDNTHLRDASIDNIRYGKVDFSDSDPKAVPTPAVLLPNLALMGLNAMRRRTQTES